MVFNFLNFSILSQFLVVKLIKKSFFFYDISKRLIYVNVFCLTCVKLRIRVGNFKGVFARVWFNIAMTSDRLSFASVDVDKSYSLTLPPLWKICVTGGHVTSGTHGLSFND